MPPAAAPCSCSACGCHAVRPRWLLFSVVQLASVYLIASVGFAGRRGGQCLSQEQVRLLRPTPCPQPLQCPACPECPDCGAAAGLKQQQQQPAPCPSLPAQGGADASPPPTPRAGGGSRAGALPELNPDPQTEAELQALFELERPRFEAYHAEAAAGAELRRRHGTLRIAGFTRLWPPPIHNKGGMQYHAQHLYSRLAALGHLVHVFTTGPPRDVRTHYFRVDPHSLHLSDAQPGAANVVIHQTPSSQNARYSVHWYHSTLQHFQKVSAQVGAFDVAHSESWAGVANAYQLGLPMAVTWHGSMLDWFRNEMNLIIHNSRLKNKAPSDQSVARLKDLGTSVAYETFALQGVPHHIVISDSAAADLRAADLIPADRVHLVYNGVNEANFAPDPSARGPFLAKHGIDPGSYVLGCGGRLTAEKGHGQLSRAAEVVLRKYKDVALIVAGTGSEGGKYEKLRKAGLRVVMVGMLGQKELAAFYNAIDAFVDPYWQHHGLNTVMIEAALSGTPLIATDLATSRTTVPNAAFGRTFGLGMKEELVAAVEHLRAHKELRAAIGRNLRERALRLFTSTVMAQAYENVLYQAKLHPYLHPLNGEVVCKDTYPAMCFRLPGAE
eukprot:TRINITY_DN9318_c4_g1_i1.p1 TRINITY_DN9318_c4_g1~~TRINITY_DN9318_c4_g1_i1.p1  ORF type:complete len:633 (+),score=200.07 TRINITY_DN9318_c4_g1_i1:66-1901(+)